ncbi:DUF4169 family protein [Aquidulcibacter sp.]|jgi:hypothetical protein|uniref:DUF4169 family protein n=1 Tax=Aquidulcibacter sp. TaxID=2052990 RepID=UPI003BA7C8A5
MAEIINLRQARKAKARTANAAKGEANRIAFGRTKLEKLATEKAKTQTKTRLDGHLLTKATNHEPD